VTGPTGSGKSTTLYGALQLLNTRDRKILTVEDPVEYQLPGINQIPVNPAIGLSFANLLRNLLRQDPDIMLVGEIRDLETARIAAQASLTGHLLLSTVHTNDAVGTITRLIDMGLEDYLVAAVLKGVVAQRLVRCLCPACRERRDGAWHAVGCDTCGGIGYRGRTTIAELLVFDETVARLVIQRAGVEELRAAALAGGMIDLRDDGFAKAEAGITSRDEVMRVTGAA
jgi:general secretion pathway protein E